MQPDAMGVVVGTWVLAGVVVLAVVLVWPRLARRSFAAVTGRLLTQLLASACAVLAVAATLNQQNGWYGSWSDLANDITGTPVQTGKVTRAGAAVRVFDAALARRQDTAADHTFGHTRAVTAAWLKRQLTTSPGPRGQLVHLTIPGSGSAFGPGQVTVWLPPSYTDPHQATRTYPVIEAFHGTPGTPLDFTGPIDLPRAIAQQVAARAMGEPVVVIPDYTPQGIDTECVDAPAAGSTMETWLTKTVPQWVDQHLRVRVDRGSWATLGFSSGGWCSAETSLLHPTTYGAGVLLGAYFQPLFRGWYPFGGQGYPARYDLMRLVRSEPPATNLWVQIAGRDGLSGKVSRAFAATARAPLSVTSYTVADAGHRLEVWQSALPHALIWLGHELPGFAYQQADGGVSVPARLPKKARHHPLRHRTAGSSHLVRPGSGPSRAPARAAGKGI